MAKVSLDALISREDFDVSDNIQSSGRLTSTLSITELKANSFFFSAIRKPDFQRETNEWDSRKICGLIESFLSGDLIPAIILWKNPASYTFVIDGSHRVSALAAWVNDDYGDGVISKKFYEATISDDQTDTAEKTRIYIRKNIGSFKDYELALTNPDKVKVDIVQKAKNLGTLAIQLQWVEGDASKAESSFFKINQEAVPINKTELYLLQSRAKPNGVAARAIIRSGTGHKYWSKFPKEKQTLVEKIAKEINIILFNPEFKSPIKTLDLPIAGKLYSTQTRALTLDFINIINNIDKKSKLDNDISGIKTLEILNNCKIIAKRINSSDSGSFGLHPAIYFYSQDGYHKTASFYAIVALIMEFGNSGLADKFIKAREKFEQVLINFDYMIQQIVRKYRGALNSYPYLKEFFLKIIDLLQEKNIEAAILEISQDSQFSYLLVDKSENQKNKTEDSNFSPGIKSQIFIKEAVKNALKCKICGGYIHKNSITIDHKKRKADGGNGTIENAQLSHPYCNTTFKN